MNIVKYPDPILTTPCEKVTWDKFDGELKQLAKEMLRTLPDARGIGLAAPQVGKSIQLFVIKLSPNGVPLVMVNPKIIKSQGKNRVLEGCLSLLGFWHFVKRARVVVVEGQGLDGEPFRIEGEGLLAMVLQHEIDHLNGILFIDRISKKHQKKIMMRIKQVQETGRWL